MPFNNHYMYLVRMHGAAVDSREGSNTAKADRPKTGVQADERPSRHIDSSPPVRHPFQKKMMKPSAGRMPLTHVSADPQARWA